MTIEEVRNWKGQYCSEEQDRVLWKDTGDFVRGRREGTAPPMEICGLQPEQGLWNPIQERERHTRTPKSSGAP